MPLGVTILPKAIDYLIKYLVTKMSFKLLVKGVQETPPKQYIQLQFSLIDC